MRPPERILTELLVLSKISAHTPPLIVCQCMSVLLKKSVDSRDASVPTIFEILKSQPDEYE